MKEEETKTKASIEAKKKLSSRKFAVWIVWLIIVVLIMILCTVITVISKHIEHTFTELLGNILDKFFVISLFYLGVNVTQKGIFALENYILQKTEKTEKKEEPQC